MKRILALALLFCALSALGQLPPRVLRNQLAAALKPAASTGGGGPVGTNYWPHTWSSYSVNSGNFTLGTQFKVGTTNITISALGRFVLVGNNQVHALGLYNLAGTLLASGSITATNPTANTQMYAAITPVVLAAGTTNMVVSLENSDSFIQSSTGDYIAALFLNGYWASGTSLQYPNGSSGGQFYPPCFIYQ